jgi:L-ascorbate metabolism protein UlaG (beta-lactamase superfamily)
MKLTWIDLNSWIFEIAGVKILVDPWLVDPLVFYGQPWLFTAHHATPPIYTPQTLPPIDLILLSQGLDDHCHRPTLAQLDRTIPVVASPAAAKVVSRLGYTQVTSLAHWQTHTIETLKLLAIPGASVGSIENGYILESNIGHRLYYEPHMFDPQLQSRVGTVDVVIAPIIGQTLPGLGQIIMGPEQALALAQALQPRYFLPTTAGDIQATGLLTLLFKSAGSPAEFKQSLQTAGLETQLLTLTPGETVEL